MKVEDTSRTVLDMDGLVSLVICGASLATYELTSVFSLQAPDAIPFQDDVASVYLAKCKINR